MLIVALIVSIVAVVLPAQSAPPAIRQGLEIEDLGAPVKSSVPVRYSLVENGRTGELHFVGNLASNPLQVFDFNLTQGTSHVTQPVPGAGWRSWTAFPHSNGKFYFGTEGPMLIAYDPATKDVETYKGDVPSGKRGDMGQMVEAPDGTLYVAGYGMFAWRFHPETKQLKRYGELPGFKYFYTMAYREPYLYVCLAGGGDWYLLAWNMKTEERKTYLEPTAAEKGTNCIRHVGEADDGYAYFYGRFHVDGKPVERHYRLVDGKPRHVEKKPDGLWSSHNQGTKKAWALPQVIEYEFDTAALTPTGWNDGAAVLRWRKKGDERWTTLTAKATQLDNATLRRLALTADGTFLGCTAPYGVFFEYDPVKQTSKHLGRAVGNIYDLVCDGDLAYMSGYSKVFAVYDRTKPWSYKPGGNETHANPTPLLGWGKRNCYMDIGAEGKVYIGGRESRHATGGVVGVYDPKTGERGTLREEFKVKQIYDLRTVNDGSIVVVSWHDELVSYDAARGEIIKSIPMPEDAILAGNLFDGGEDCVVCVTASDVREKKNDRLRTKAIENPGMVYKVNVLTGEVVYKRAAKERFFAGTIRELNRRVRKGPDGCGWLFVRSGDNKTYLARIHPDDGAVEKVVETGYAGHLCFKGDDVYMYNGGEGSWKWDTLKRIRKVFQR